MFKGVQRILSQNLEKRRLAPIPSAYHKPRRTHEIKPKEKGKGFIKRAETKPPCWSLGVKLACAEKKFLCFCGSRLVRGKKWICAKRKIRQLEVRQPYWFTYSVWCIVVVLPVIINPRLTKHALRPRIIHPTIMQQCTHPNLGAMWATEFLFPDQRMETPIPFLIFSSGDVSSQSIFFYPIDFKVPKGFTIP